MYPLIIATGPLTSDTLSRDIAALVGAEHLYFYDAISPIVLAETLDMTQGVSRLTMGTQPAWRCGCALSTYVEAGLQTRLGPPSPAAWTTGKATI